MPVRLERSCHPGWGPAQAASSHQRGSTAGLSRADLQADVHGPSVVAHVQGTLDLCFTGPGLGLPVLGAHAAPQPRALGRLLLRRGRLQLLKEGIRICTMTGCRSEQAEQGTVEERHLVPGPQPEDTVQCLRPSGSCGHATGHCTSIDHSAPHQDSLTCWRDPGCRITGYWQELGLVDPASRIQEIGRVSDLPYQANGSP